MHRALLVILMLFSVHNSSPSETLSSPFTNETHTLNFPHRSWESSLPNPGASSSAERLLKPPPPKLALIPAPKVPCDTMRMGDTPQAPLIPHFIPGCRLRSGEKIWYAWMWWEEAKRTHHVLACVRERRGTEDAADFGVHFRENVEEW